MTDTLATVERWLTQPHPRPDARLTLICFPHAGGDASAYRPWARDLPPTIEVRPVQPPGRQNRLGEAALTSVDAIVAAVAPLVAVLGDRPYAFFGHSMGATVAFETARWLRRAGQVGPTTLLVSGRTAPHLPPRARRLHQLPPAEFISEIVRLRGTPAEVLQHPELAAIIVPVIRADMTAAETYTYRPEAPLNCPITAFGGTTDGMATPADVAAWSQHTTGTFTQHTITGGHFFHRDPQAGMIERITALLG
jgi:medium-chain acyl-[acyl-carrier-protein] hydrolase